jgi:hypothetical protein
METTLDLSKKEQKRGAQFGVAEKISSEIIPHLSTTPNAKLG